MPKTSARSSRRSCANRNSGFATRSRRERSSTSEGIAAGAALAPRFLFLHAGFLHDRLRSLEPQPGRVLRGHVLGNAPEGFGADAVLISDLLQRLEEADEIDDAFARHQPLIIEHFCRRAFLRVGEMEVND